MMQEISEKERLAITPGRFLYCKDCRRFRRMAIEWDKSKGHKVILCRVCHEEQARLVPWSEEEWIERRFADNVGLTITTILGMKRVVAVIRGPEKKRKRGEKRKRVEKQKRKARSFSFNLSKILTFGVAIPATALGILHLVLTAVAIQYKIFIWPFTLAWAAFDWAGVETLVLGGMLVSSVAIALGVLGIILLRRR